jgi:hypothetical protein
MNPGKDLASISTNGLTASIKVVSTTNEVGDSAVRDSDRFAPRPRGEQLASHTACQIQEGNFDLSAGALDAGDRVLAVRLEITVFVDFEDLFDVSRCICVEDANFDLLHAA